MQPQDCIVTDLDATSRTRLKRLPQRGSYDRYLINEILDEGIHCHVGFVHETSPIVLPMAHAREGDTLFLHGSVGSRLLRTLAGGAPISVAVTLVDGLVVARSGVHSSLNYRSVVLFGVAESVEEPDAKAYALDVIVEHLIPGRTRDQRPATGSEIRQTKILALPITEGSAKVRRGDPVDEPEDLSLGTWAGVIPISTQFGPAVPSDDLASDIESPRYITKYRRPRTPPSDV